MIFLKYFIGEEGGTGREFNTFSDFMDAISDIALAYEENGEDYFEIKVDKYMCENNELNMHFKPQCQTPITLTEASDTPWKI